MIYSLIEPIRSKMLQYVSPTVWHSILWNWSQILHESVPRIFLGVFFLCCAASCAVPLDLTFSRA